MRRGAALRSPRLCVRDLVGRVTAMDVTRLNIFVHCKFLRHAGKGLMAAVVASIIGLACSSVFEAALTPGLRSDSAAARAGYAALSVVYATVAVMVAWCYLATMLTDPGGVPPGWSPFEDPLEAEALQQPAALEAAVAAAADAVAAAGGSGADRARAYLERPRWCKKCKAWKPPRAHHCSMSGRCVLKMDHYCVWVANTVGLLNYKHFVLFLVWALAGCLLSSALLVRPCVAFFAAAAPAVRPMVSSFLAFVFTLAFTLALLAFVVMHLRLAATNHSTIEAYEKRTVRPWPYDKGAARNLTEVFGREPRRWALPLVTPEERRALLAPYLEAKGGRQYDVEAGRYGGGDLLAARRGAEGGGGGGGDGGGEREIRLAAVPVLLEQYAPRSDEHLA